MQQTGIQGLFGLLLTAMISSSKILGVISFELEPANFQFSEKELQILKQLVDILAGVFVGS